MATKKRGLGRGLDALLGGASVSAMQEEAAKVDTRELQQLPLELVQRGKYQPVATWIRRRWKNWRSRSAITASCNPSSCARSRAAATRSSPASDAGAPASRPAWNVPALVREVPDEAAIAMALIENISARISTRSKKRWPCSGCSRNSSSLNSRWPMPWASRGSR